VAGAVGLVTAMEAAAADRDRFVAEVADIRERFERLLEGVATRTVPKDLTLVQHAHLRFPGLHNETVLIRLDRAGVAASAASACQSGATTVSHVLTAMGFSTREARECLRFSFGWSSTPADAEAAAHALRALAGEAA
jgi:cysteine desulfurase